MSLYRLQTPAQLALLEPELRPGIVNILDETGPDFGKTVDQVWKELHEHLTDPASKGLWVLYENGHVVAWAACKIYYDEDRASGCITWAWASPKGYGARSRAVMTAMEAFCDAAGCEGIYCQRRTRLKAFERNLRRYGWTLQAVVFGRQFNRAMTQRVGTKEAGDGVQASTARIDAGARAPASPPAAPAARGDARTRRARPDGAAAGDGDRDAVTTGDCESTIRRTRIPARRDGEPPEQRDALPPTVGTP